MERYECDRCGACCQGHLIVEAYQLDVLREPKLIGADTGSFYDGMTHEQVVDALADEYRCLVLAAAKSHPCNFLGDDKLCRIYPTRPNACVAMQAGDEQCQSARQDAGMPPLLPVTEK
jgi:Fe-S-cluster containining protein